MALKLQAWFQIAEQVLGKLCPRCCLFLSASIRTFSYKGFVILDWMTYAVIHQSESTQWVKIQTNNAICWFHSSLVQCKPIQEVLCIGATFHWMSFSKPNGTLVENNGALTWHNFRHNEWAKAKAGHCLNATISTGLHLNTEHWSTAVALWLSEYFMLIFNYTGTVCYSWKPTDSTTLELCDKAELSWTTNTWYFINLKNSFVSF